MESICQHHECINYFLQFLHVYQFNEFVIFLYVLGDLHLEWRCTDCTRVSLGIPVGESTRVEGTCAASSFASEMMDLEETPDLSFSIGQVSHEVPQHPTETSVDDAQFSVGQDSPTTPVYEIVASGSQRGKDVLIDNIGF